MGWNHQLEYHLECFHEPRQIKRLEVDLQLYQAHRRQAQLPDLSDDEIEEVEEDVPLSQPVEACLGEINHKQVGKAKVFWFYLVFLCFWISNLWWWICLVFFFLELVFSEDL